ncbi:MAG: MCP four helix bundle domain-containing protein, partial [Candidatus Marinimicrobia bacterium]|nr:MCP four helix bundle domain-containing protein [Candidatus Neomarinimicrobiota bacterium]
MFNNLRIGTKLTASFLLLIVLMVIIIMVGVTRLNHLKSDLDIIVDDRYQKVHLAEQIITNAMQIAVEMRNLAIETDVKARQVDLEQIKTNQKDNLNYMARLEKIVTSREAIALLRIIDERQNTYQEIQNEVIALGQANNIEAIKNLVGSEKTTQARGEYEQAVRNLIAYQEKMMEDTQSETLQNYQSSRNLMILIGILALLFAAAVAFYLIRAIVPPINNIVAIAKRVAGGDLSGEFPPVKGHDEIGELNAAFA